MFDTSQLFGGTSAAGAFYPTTIDQSLRFEDGDTAYLSRTPASAGNRQKFTWSGWIKRGNISQYGFIFVVGDATNHDFLLLRDTNVLEAGGEYGSTNYRIRTSALLRDPSAWYHIVWSVDTTQATGGDRQKLYVNGVLQTVTNYTTVYPQNQNTYVNSTSAHRIGTYLTGSSSFDGYMAEVHFTDGTAYTADDFGELKSGIWIPKEPSVTYGTNGFKLTFEDSSSIGDDTSGEGNDWTVNNLVASDVVPDSPTNNFCVLNTIYKGENTTHTLYEGNLKWESTGDDRMHGTVGITSGKWYWEGYYLTASGTNLYMGVRNSDSILVTDGASFYRTSAGEIWVNGASSQTGVTAAVQTDVIGIAFNADDGELSVYLNGSQIGSTATGITIDAAGMMPFVGNGNGSGTKRVVFNFGQDSTFAGNITAGGNTDANGIGDFKYTVPSSYLALCTSNLPDPVIDPAQDATPEDHFNVVTWSGTGSGTDRSFTGVGFSPDLVWTKRRDSGEGNSNHQLYDAVRGVNNYLASNSTAAEGSTN